MTPSALALPPRPALAPDVAREIDSFESEVQRFLDGDLAPERFRAFRLAHGVYGQRQPGVQMIRVKIPTGAVTGAQMRRLADVAERFGNGRVHLTTRQDFQMHFVPLESVTQVLRLVAETGLTTREACGNSVRNVTACPLSGEIADEIFPVSPYARATFSYLTRNAFCQQMARKFKIAFSGCPEDCAATAIHDIGALARVRVEGGRERRGFRLLVGGGLGPTPFVAQLFDEFVPVERLLLSIRGILEVFAVQGNRRQKARARLKFVVHRMGIEAFRAEAAAAMAALSEREASEAEIDRYAGEAAEERAGAGHRPRVSDRTGDVERRPSRDVSRDPGGDGTSDAAAIDSLRYGGGPCRELARWVSFNTRAHRNPDLAVVTILVPLGDLESGELRAIANLAERYSQDQARVGRDQNLVLPRVHRDDLAALHASLGGIGLAHSGAGTALDITSCPGADTCSLGITSSKGLTRALREEIAPLAANGGLESLRGVTIKISGCPNSCGQHHVAGIGLHGVIRKVNGRQVPAYQIHLGGRAAGGDARIGAALEKIPARNVPKTVSSLLHLFREERSGNESFADFAARLPEERLHALVKPFADDVSTADALAYDWGREEPFSTEEMGTGECAGAGTDPAAHPFEGVEAELLQTRLFIEREQWVDALANLNRAQFSLARVLLERLGRKPDSDYEVACEIRARIIDRGYAGDLWNDNHRAIERALRPRLPDPESVRELYRLAGDLLEEARGTYPNLARAKAAGAGDVAG